jgi:ribosome-binding ATPase YchF (GTP1/OBG family)
VQVKRDPKNKKYSEALETLEQTLAWLKEGKDVRFIIDDHKWGYKEIDVINELMLLTAKPASASRSAAAAPPSRLAVGLRPGPFCVLTPARALSLARPFSRPPPLRRLRLAESVYLINMSESDFLKQKNKFLGKVKAYVDANCPGESIIPYSAEFESKYAALADPAAQEAMLAEHKIKSQLPKMVKTGYHLLRLIHFFTAGSDEVKCWTIRNPCKAPQAAGTIHTDFERGFIMAEVMHYEDWHTAGSDAACKATGKYMQKGKEYIMEDGDIVFFKFNVTADKKK